MVPRASTWIRYLKSNTRPIFEQVERTPYESRSCLSRLLKCSVHIILARSLQVYAKSRIQRSRLRHLTKRPSRQQKPFICCWKRYLSHANLIDIMKTLYKLIKHKCNMMVFRIYDNKSWKVSTSVQAEPVSSYLQGKTKDYMSMLAHIIAPGPGFKAFSDVKLKRHTFFSLTYFLITTVSMRSCSLATCLRERKLAERGHKQQKGSTLNILLTSIYDIRINAPKAAWTHLRR